MTRTMLVSLAAFLLVVPAARAAEPVHFHREVIPLLTKLGCNSGACHGSFQGRGGFRLSLLGFDPRADYNALVCEARGRRVFPASPENSLLLTKPTATVPHGGRKRFAVDSDSYRILRDWIAQGLSGAGEGPVVVRIEVSPAEAVLEPGKEAALAVKAHWSDGVVQDATRLALFESTSDAVAEVGATGQVKSLRPGRAAITIRYLGQVAAVPVTVPQGKTPVADAPGSPGQFVRQNYIDDFMLAEWKKLGLQPAPLASDAEFVRRVYLDVIGTLPTVEELKRFLASNAADKRSKLIDELLERPEYVDYWAVKWGDLLRAHRRALGEKGLVSFHEWLKQSLRDNKPVDRLVREILTSQGNLYVNGPTAFFYVDRTPEDLAETTAQVLLGIRLQCARCHHHPFEVWSQDDYYGMAAFFARIQRKDTGENGSFGGSQSVKIGSTGVLAHPATGKPVPPRWLGQPASIAAPPESADPRVALAEWVTRPDNPFFARNFVNRYWGYLFGVGLVEPIDDLRATNPSAHPALLEALARDWVAHRYDLKHLLRTICNSRVYQLASETTPERDREGRFFTHRQPRRLPAEVLLDAMHQAAGTEEGFENLPPGTRAISLPDPGVASYFLDTFGRPRRTSTCECERGMRADLAQVLHLVNGEFIHRIATDPKGRLARLLAANKPDAEIIEELYLASFGRAPTAQEQQSARKLVALAPSRQDGYQDFFWALLNCGEFLFNH